MAKLTDEQRQQKQARALSIHEELVQITRAENQAAARRAELLATVRRERLHEPFGQSFGAYAEQHGFSSSSRQAFAVTHMWKELDERPELKALFVAGGACWTKVRDLVALKAPATDAELVELAKNGSAADIRARKLQEQVQRGESPSTHLEVSLESKARAGHYRGILSLRLKESLGRELSISEAIDHALDTAITAETRPAPGEDGKVRRLILPEALARENLFKGTDGFWIHGADGPVTLGKATSELLRCCSESLTGDGKRRPAVPRRLVRLLWSQDEGMCSVPGCRHRRYLHIHHEGGYDEVGHDLEHMMLLCGGHHRMRHQDWIRIEGARSTGFRFFRIDGVQITGSRPIAREVA